MGELTIDTKATTFKDILLEHVKRITKLSSVELRGGFWTVMEDKDGKIKRIYIPDTREALCNSVYCLNSLMENKIEKYKEQIKTVKSELENLKKSFLDYTKIKETEVLGEDYYRGEEKTHYEEYKIKKMELYRKMFTWLCMELSSKNWGEIGGRAF